MRIVWIGTITKDKEVNIKKKKILKKRTVPSLYKETSEKMIFVQFYGTRRKYSDNQKNLEKKVISWLKLWL